MRPVCGSRTRWHRITGPLRPATIVREGRPARGRTRTGEVGARRAAAYTTGLRNEGGRPGSNGPRRSGAPVLFRLSYVREVIRPAGIEPATSAVAEQCSSAELRALAVLGKEPPAGVEPAPRPYKGRVLAVDTTEADGDGRSRTRSSSVQARRSAVRASSPGIDADGWSRTISSARRRVYSTVSSPVLSARTKNGKGGRPGSNRRLRGSRPRMLPLHHGHHARGRPDSNRRPLA